MPKQDDGKHIYSWLCHRNAIFDVAFCGLSFPLARPPQPPPLPRSSTPEHDVTVFLFFFILTTALRMS
jgi:hypothetical protein